MKKGICLGCLPKELSVEDKFTLAYDAGFDGVEINAVDSDDEVLRLKSLADRAANRDSVDHGRAALAVSAVVAER